MYVYDTRPNKECAMVFRAEHRKCEHCPKCKAERLNKDAKAKKKLY